MSREGSRLGLGAALRLDHLLVLFMALPNLAWALLDRGVGAGDSGAHAYAAMRLYHALGAGAEEWWREMMAVAPKPPMAVWLAHLGAPLGKWLGHFDSGLLLATVVAGYVALVLLHKSLLIFFQDRVAALAGCLAVAAAPLWLAYAKGLWMQPLQLMAVCWVLWVMAAAPRLDRLAGLLHLAAAFSFSLLVMVSTPLYCLVPGTVALARVLRSPWPAGKAWKRSLPLAALAVLLVFLLLSWYLRNWNVVVGHTLWASRFAYNVAESGLAAKARFWGAALADALLLMPLFAVFLAGPALVFRPGRAAASAEEPRPLPAMVAVLQIVVVVAVLSLAGNQEVRYVLPLLAYAAVLIAWALRTLGRKMITHAVLLLLASQFVVFQLASFGFLTSPILPYAFSPPSRDGGNTAALMDGILDAEPALPRGKVLLATQGLRHCGLMFSALDLQFRAAKRPEYDRLNARVFESVEFRLDKTICDLEELWGYVMTPEVAAAVVIDEKKCPPDLTAERGYRPLLDAAREFSRRVRESGEFVRVPLMARTEIEIFRSTRVEKPRGNPQENRRKPLNDLENQAKKW